MIRTREFISNLSYNDLCIQGIIPDLNALIRNTQSIRTIKQYPSFVKKRGCYSHIGLMVDYLIRACIRSNCYVKEIQEIILGKEAVFEMIPHLDIQAQNVFHLLYQQYITSNDFSTLLCVSYLITALYYPNTFDVEEIKSHLPELYLMVESIINKWKSFGDHISGTICFNQEYSHGSVQGHPDVVVLSNNGSFVLDIKNSYDFNTMSKESSLQVLTYFVLMRQNMINIRYVGFILPMQHDILIYDLINWDYSRFLNIMIGSQTPQTIQPIRIGSNISKGSSIVQSIKNFLSKYPDHPIQMFLANPKTGKRSVATYKQVSDAYQFIKSYGIKYFTHSPYIINLCANAFDQNTGYWQQKLLNEELELTVKMGGMGVVVHTGAHKNQPESHALLTMENMIRNALNYATNSCPLLLETPCGEGTEVVTKLEELAAFFLRFNDFEKTKLGICIDTAHVFGAGYDPLLYLDYWHNNHIIPIKLVHYNDSAVECGSKKDKHAPPGRGHIGKAKMDDIAIWCNERNIPMIIE